MSYRWNDKAYSTFAEMRDDVVFDWLSANGESVEQTLGIKTDEEIADMFYQRADARKAIKSVGLSRQDVVEGLVQARLGVEQEGLS